MADKPSEKTFTQFLEEQPAPAETMILTGHAARSAKAGSFSFTSGGQTMELPVEAVERHNVVAEGPQRLVEIEIIVSKIDPKVLKPVLADGVTAITDPVTIPENIATDPAGFAPDPSGGAQPFVLATPHHARTSTIAAQMGMPSAAQLATTPLRGLRTIFYYDRLHTLKEPIFDTYTLPESLVPDPANTLAEGVGVQTGGGQVVNPAMQAQAQAQALTTPVTDAVTIVWLDQSQNGRVARPDHRLRRSPRTPLRM